MVICGKGSGIILFFPSPAFGWASFVHFVPFVVISTAPFRFRGIKLRLPHPVRFALHKLIVAGRRNSDKAENDRAQAAMVLQAVAAAGDGPLIRDIYTTLPPKWKRVVRSSLAEVEIPGIAEFVEPT
jgi:hypothetical protein